MRLGGATGGAGRWQDVAPHPLCCHLPSRLQQADLVLAVLDAAALPPEPAGLGAALGSLLPPAAPPCILVLNKADLLGGDGGALRDACARGDTLPPATLLSCKTGEGLDRLLELLARQLARL